MLAKLFAFRKTDWLQNSWTLSLYYSQLAHLSEFHSTINWMAMVDIVGMIRSVMSWSSICIVYLLGGLFSAVMVCAFVELVPWHWLFITVQSSTRDTRWKSNAKRLAIPTVFCLSLDDSSVDRLSRTWYFIMEWKLPSFPEPPNEPQHIARRSI